MSEIDNKLSKRISSLVAVGALPSGLLSLVGDFFSPKGGWIAVGALGVVALLLLIYLIVFLSVSDGNGKQPWWHRLTSNDKDINWIWVPRSPFSSHGIHVLALFVVICLFSAGKSLAAIDKGGYLGANLNAVASAQQQLGISKEILISVQKTAAEVAALNKKAENFKKETSENPQKELANLGFKWSDEDLWQAVLREDATVVELFVKGGFSPSNNTGYMVEKALQSGNIKLITVLAGVSLKSLKNNSNVIAVHDKQCDDIFAERIDIREEVKKVGNTYTRVSVGDKLKHDKYSELIINTSAQSDSPVKVLLKKVCATDEFLEVVKKRNDLSKSDLKINPSAENANTAKYWSSVSKLLS